MDAATQSDDRELLPRQEEASELRRWLSVRGDMDDFIFYGETVKEHSER